MSLGLFAEDNSHHVTAAVQAVLAVAVALADDFQLPLIEHEPQQGAVVLAAALAVAEDDQLLLAEILEQMIEVLGGDGEEDAAFVARRLEHFVEAALEDHSGGQVQAAGVGAIHFLADGIAEDADRRGFLLDGEFFVGRANVPAIFIHLDFAAEAGKIRGEVVAALAGGGEERQNGFFQFLQAESRRINDLAVVDVDSFAAFVAIFAGDAAQPFPEAGKFFAFRGRFAIDRECTAPHDQRPQHRPIPCLVNPCQNHGGDYIVSLVKFRLSRRFAPGSESD